MPTESQKLEILVQDRAPSTRVKYRQQLGSIQRLLGGDVGLATGGQINHLLNSVPNPHTRHTYINIISHLRPDLKPHLNSYRLENLKNVRVHVAQVNSRRDPPSYHELCDRRDWAFENGRWAEFIVQALTLEFGVRSMDLVMDVSDRENRDLTKNHLIRDVTRVVWIRNRYKTVKNYRPKTHVIQDPKIVFAARQLNPGPFTTKLVDCHPDRTSEADYFRVQIEHLLTNDRNVLQKLQSLCRSRGTSWEQVVTNYNLRMDAGL